MFTAPKRDLARALESVAAVASKKAIQPILRCARLTVSKQGRLTIQATDLFITATTTIDVSRSKSADIAVDAAMMLARVKSLEDGDVVVEIKAKGIEVRSGKARKFTLPIAPGEDYPTLPSVDDAVEIMGAPGSELARLLDGARYASSRDESRAHLACVLFRVRDGVATCAATDGHRLAVRTLDLGTKRTADDMAIPNAAVAELHRIASSAGDAVVTLATIGATLVARTATSSVSLKLADVQCPPFEHIASSLKPTAHVTVVREQLIGCIKAVCVAADVHGRLAVDVTPSRMQLLASSADAGEFVDELPASIDGGSHVRASFMWRYVADALAAVDGSDVTLGFIGELDPMVLRTADTTAIVMPLRV
jgi:DNA polymerase-3 subunit beta